MIEYDSVSGTGIIQGDLIILESHVAYSTSKEKAAVQFYIMQCTKPNINDLIKTPIRDAINRFAYNDKISFLFLNVFTFSLSSHSISIFFVSINVAC